MRSESHTSSSSLAQKADQEETTRFVTDRRYSIESSSYTAIGPNCNFSGHANIVQIGAVYQYFYNLSESTHIPSETNETRSDSWSNSNIDDLTVEKKKEILKLAIFKYLKTNRLSSLKDYVATFVKTFKTSGGNIPEGYPFAGNELDQFLAKTQIQPEDYTNFTELEFDSDWLGKDCQSVKFSNINFSSARFIGLTLKKAEFNDAICKLSTFENSNLDGAKLSGADFSSAKFTNVSFKSTSFINTLIDDIEMNNVKHLRATHLAKARWTKIMSAQSHSNKTRAKFARAEKKRKRAIKTHKDKRRNEIESFHNQLLPYQQKYNCSFNDLPKKLPDNIKNEICKKYASLFKSPYYWEIIQEFEEESTLRREV